MLKRAFKIVIILGFLTSAAIIAAAFFVDPNQLKEPLIRKIEAAVNGRVELDRIELHILPVPSVVLEDMRILSLDGPFSGRTLSRIASTRMTLDLRKLLSKRLAIALGFNRPVIYYRTAEERSNLEGIFKSPNPSASSEENSWIEKTEVMSLTVERGIVYRLEGNQGEEEVKPIVREVELDVESFSFSASSSPGEQKIPVKLSGIVNESPRRVMVEGSLVLDPGKRVYRTDDMKLDLGGSVFTVKVSWEAKELGDYHYQAEIGSRSLDFKALAAVDPAFEKRLPAGAQITGPSSLSVQLSGNVSQMQTSGNLDFGEAKIAYGDYLKKGARTPAKITWSYYGPLQGLLSSGALKGKIEGQRFFVLERYEPEDFKADFHVVGKQWILDAMTFRIFEGTMSGNGMIRFGEKAPQWKFNLQASQLDANALMTAVGGFRDVFSGKGDLGLALEGEGSEMKDIKSSSTGDGNLSLSAGKILALNMAKEVLNQNLVDGLNAALKANPASSGAPKIAPPRFALQTQETNYSSFASGFRVEKGFLQIPDLRMVTETSTMNLVGKASLEGDLDLKGVLLLARSETDAWLGEFPGKSSLVDLEGKLTVPFTVSGALPAPIVAPDVNTFVERLKTASLQNLQQKAEEKLPAPLQKPNGDILKDLLR